MATPSEKSSYQRYEIFTQPRALISSYALKSSAPHISAAKLGIDVIELATKEDFEFEQVEAPRRKDIAAQVAESFYIDALREILRWENMRSSDSHECCLPFVDVASDALAETVLQILISDSKSLSLSSARIRTIFHEASQDADVRPLVRAYYLNYIRRLILFCLTQNADLDIGPKKYFPSMEQRDLYFFNITYPCESAVVRLDTPPPERPITEAGLEEMVAYTSKVASKINSMGFVSGLAFPKLRKKTILCGTENLSHKSIKKKDTIFLNGDTPDRNVLFRWDKIESVIGASLSPTSRDLVEVAAYVFTGDTLVHRTARWRRSLNFVIPVRDLKGWESVTPDLGMAASFLSGDHISFEFVQRQIKEDDKPIDGKPISGDCVCLLSGGLDSFAGSLELIQDGRQPVLVGHFKQSHIAKRQRLVAESLRGFMTKEYTAKTLTALRLDTGLAPGREKHGFKGKLEYSQRLRSFLFLSLATAVAEGLGLQEIFIPENGILALNVPLAACRTGTRSSRSAHPRFLRHFEKIVNHLYDREFKVRNPLIFKTKSEALEIFKDTGTEDDLVNSVTCSRFSYGVMMDKRRGERNCTHCGTCFACLIRRAAMIKADLADQDAEYIIQPFKEYTSLKEGERLDLIHLIDFCKKIADASEDQILLRHPQLFLPNQYFPGISMGKIAALEIARMYRRFAKEIMDIIKKEAANNANETALPLLEIFGLVGDK